METMKRWLVAVAVALAIVGFTVARAANTPSWTLKWSTDFPTSAKLGQFSGCDNNVSSADAYCSGLPASLRSQWWAYPYPWPDTATERHLPVGGYYDPASTVWISGGQMHIRMFRTTSWVHSAALVPKAADGVKYGEFFETFSVSQVAPGYKSAHLLWPTSGSDKYEVDFPENAWTTSICAYAHSTSEATQASFCPSISWTGWHTSEIQWAPGSVTFYLDGKQVGQVTGDWVPTENMAWIIQNESSLTGPAAPENSSAQINISHVAVYSYGG